MTRPWSASVITIFPEMFPGPLGHSLAGRALERDAWRLDAVNLRDFTTDRHQSVDDTPFGGGAGMVMRPEPWGEALDAVAPPYAPAAPLLVVPSPAGRRLDQATARALAREPWLVVACGRYEGIDARVVADAAQRMPVLELSIGDYVVNGGEVAALVLVEAVARLVPGVVGNPESLVQESHEDGLLEHPVYTRPPVWRGHGVPDVLRGGDHAAVARWRREEALRRTARRRPDLLDSLDPSALSPADLAVLADAGWTAPPPVGAS